MARIAGVDVPNNKQARIGLTYIFGIGDSRAAKILAKADVDPLAKVPFDGFFHARVRVHHVPTLVARGSVRLGARCFCARRFSHFNVS